AGKSTTMNIICGVLNQTSGEVFINGISLREHPRDAKQYIGFLPQNPPLHLDLTVDEYLYHCADLRQIDKKEIPQAVERVKQKCGIAHFSERLIKNLSGGYRQRVGIAQSIIHDPLFVILDEPTNGLDPNQILAVRALIKDIAKEKAVLISTHILSEVQATCDYIKMIERGDVVFSGTKEEFNNYMAPDTLIVIVGNSPEQKELLEVEGVTYVEYITPTRLRVHFDSDRSIVKRIIGKSIEKNWKLKEIHIENESLDTIFAKLSGKLNTKK
ncbi:MAG: ABC transporter ATP-binding protein, partial [Rikenellaceae bacterium]